MNGDSEGDHLSEILEDGTSGWDEDGREEDWGKSEMMARYLLAKDSKIGALISCPRCEKMFTKRTYHHTFCRGKCKDQYWNYIENKY